MTYFQGTNLACLESFAQDSRVDAFLNVPLGLLKQLSYEQHYACGSISALVVLSDGCSGYHCCSGVLDLHLCEEDLAVLGHLEVTRPIYEELDGASGSEVGCDDIGEPDCSRRIDLEGLRTSHGLCSRVEQLDGGHDEASWGWRLVRS